MSDERITLFAELLLPIPVPTTFTYRVPFVLNDRIRIGQRAVVPFGATKIMSGIVVGISREVPALNTVKYIIDLLDDEPLVNDLQLRFWDWVKDYYMCHLGEVMQAALPSALKLSSESTIAMSPDYVLDTVPLNDSEYLIVEALQVQPKIAISTVSKIIGYRKVMPIIKTMIEKGIVIMEEELNEKYKAKYERFVRLAGLYRDESQVQELMNALT